MDPITAFHDPALFGSVPAFKDVRPWTPWFPAIKAVYGLPLTESEMEGWYAYTGRSRPPRREGYPTAIFIVGRRAGKSSIGAMLACHAAVTRRRDSNRTREHALLIAQDQRSSTRVMFDLCRENFASSPIMRQSVVKETIDSIELVNGSSLSVYPSRPSAVRGLTATIAVLDELAFMRSSDFRPMDREMLTAIRPCLATTGGRLLIFSSPYAQSGALYDLHRAHYGRDDSSVLVWQAAAPQMNLSLDTNYLERMKEEDPTAYASEVLGEFRQGISSLFDPAALDRAVVSGRGELPRVRGVTYTAFCDPSGGRADSMTLGIGHRDGERAVLDLLRAWTAPFSPAGAVAEAADLLRSYSCARVVGDRYGAGFCEDEFRRNGITYEPSEKNRSELYLEMLSFVNSGRVELPDRADLMRELRGLERRTSSAGRDRIDHVPGAHDDLANSVAGVLYLLLRRKRGSTWGDVIAAIREDRGFVDEDRGWIPV